MVFPNLMNSAVLILCVLVLATRNYQACAFRHPESWTSNYRLWDNIKPDNIKPESLVKGLCADSIIAAGYKCNEFEVTTNDGYILSIQRIPEGRSKISSNATKEPVLIQHGLMMDGSSWFMNSPEQNVPMILADNGFDVWVTNGRGTKFSRKHTTLDSSHQQYWDWTWDDLVNDEMPAIVDFVFNQTGGQKINYLGHSLGTMIALISLSEGKWVNQVKSVALLSPVAYLSHMTTKLGIMSAKYVLGKKFTPKDITEFDPKGQRVLSFVRGICSRSGINCNDLFTAATGDNCCLDEAAFVRFLKVEPQPTSKKTMFHLAYTFLNDNLTKFDYGREEINQEHYGQPEPPMYNLSNIPKDVPIFMSYGGRDALSDVVDVQRLLTLHFQNHDKTKLKVQFIQGYAHADYMMAVNAKDLVYKQVTSFFKQKF